MDYSIIMNNVDAMTLNASLHANNDIVDIYQQTFGDVKTLRISELLGLTKDSVMKTTFQTGGASFAVNSSVNGGFSVYFVQSLSDAKSK